MLIAVNQLFEYHLWLNIKQSHTSDESSVFISAMFISAVGSLACSQSLGLKAGGA
jgi:hypothetical protein